MKPIKLQLLLENCEILDFDWKDVESVSFENTYDAVDIDSDGVITTIKCCQKFYICVDGKGGEYSFDNGSSHWNERLKEGDVAFVSVLFDDDSELSYRVEWPTNGNMYYHPHQGVDTTWMKGVHLIYCCKETKEHKTQLEENDDCQ